MANGRLSPATLKTLKKWRRIYRGIRKKMEASKTDENAEENSFDSESIGGESGLPVDSEKVEDPSSSASSDALKKSLSDANTKANDAAMNLKLKLQSFSPSKRKSTSSDVKVKRANSKKKRISQMMSGASFKSKCILFKRIFKDLPIEENLIIDYSCALQRDILVHGRVYLSQNWMCFYANIFGWETLVTINWHEITAITKEKTARVIPNAVRISTSNEKHFFTSFVSRDSAYTALFRVWQNALLGQAVSPLELRKLCRSFRKREVDQIDGYPIDKEADETGDEVTENDHENMSISAGDEVSLENSTEKATDTKISVIPPTPPGSEPGNIWSAEPDMSKSEDEHSRVKETGDDGISDASSRASSPLLRRAENFLAFARKKKKLKKKSSNNLKTQKIHSLLPAASPAQSEESSDEGESGDVLCPCVGAHSGTEYCVEEYDFDVDALFEHLFSSDSDVMKRIHESRKMLDCKYHEYKKNEDGSSTRLLTYTLTLNYTIGPKHSETSAFETFSKDNTPGSFYVIRTEVYNKGIPYADSFHVASQYCLTRLAGNRCKMRIHSEVIYTKSVFAVARNMIQRNADQAFRDYFKNLALLLTEKSDAIPLKSQKKRKRQTLKQNSREDVPAAKSKSDRLLQPSGIEKMSDHNLENPEILQPSYSSISHISAVNGSKLFQAFAVLLIFLLGMNSYLFYRIYQLESYASGGKNQCVLKNLPVTDESWYNLIQRQKQAHEFEIKRLKDVIGGTAKLVKQVEVSIYDLYNELEESSKQLPELNDVPLDKKVVASVR